MKKSVLVCLKLMETKENTSQAELARTLDISTSTVNRTVKKLENMGAVEINPRSLKVIDREKILMYLASMRNPHKDIIYETRAEMNVTEIEKSMPGEIQFTAYTAYKFRYEDVPADYSEVYVYGDDEGAREVKERFPKKQGPSNLFLLKKETEVTPSLIFADLWNLKEWYSKEFVGGLRDRILE